MTVTGNIESDALREACEDIIKLREQKAELLACLKDAVDRMLGSSAAIQSLRERSIAAIARAEGRLNV